MNRSFRVSESEFQMKDKEDELALFLEMQKLEKERDTLFIHNSDDFDAPLGTTGSSPIYDIPATVAPALKVASDEFLNLENDKNDYDWLLSPPGTPLFPSLEMESQDTIMSQTETPNDRATELKSRLANAQLEPTAKSNLTSTQSASSLGLSISNGGGRKPSSSGSPGTRSATPTRRPTSNSASRSVLTSPTASSSATSKPSVSTTSKPSRSSTPTSRATLSSTKPTVSARSSTPTARSTARSSTPTSRSTTRSSTPTLRSTTRPSISTANSTAKTSMPMANSTAKSSTPMASSTTRTSTPTAPSTARSSTPTARSSARSSTPTARSTSRSSTLPARSTSLPASNPTSRATTPIRRPTTISTASDSSSPSVKSPSFPKVAPAALSRYPVLPRVSSSTVKPRPWKPSEMPGFSLDAPPNLRTSISERPPSATRGRPGVPSVRSSSVDPAPNGRIRRQSYSPSRGRPANGVKGYSGSPVPALSRAYAKANDNVSPVMYGTKMVERVINMRKLAPPRQDDKHSPHSNLSGKSSSLDSSGFGRSLSKKSLDMAMRHMDIRRSIPGNLRPLMTNIPASSMYSVRSGPAPRSRAVGVSDSPLATSSNASSEVSVNNNALCLDRNVLEDDINSERGVPSPASMHGR